MSKFSRIIQELENGYIAVVDKMSSDSEKLYVAEFSRDTKNILCHGLGEIGIPGESTPLVELNDWDEDSISDYPGSHKMHVFVLVLKDKIVGYMPVRWHWNIVQQGHRLDAKGNPIEFEGEMKIHDVAELIKTEPIDKQPNRLETWGIEGVVILTEWQHQGFGTILVRTALNYLGTNEKEVAWDPPFTDAGKALLRSLGLNHKEVRLSPGI